MANSNLIKSAFIVAVAPAVGMIFLLLFYPESQLASCPLMKRSALVLSINGFKGFEINQTRLVDVSSDGSRLGFLGLVLNVSSATAFYGKGKAYHALACGKDVTRALVTSSLSNSDLNENIEDIPKGKVKEQLKQWLPFLLNKYPQIGVLEGAYFDASGRPTALFLEYTKLIE